MADERIDGRTPEEVFGEILNRLEKLEKQMLAQRAFGSGMELLSEMAQDAPINAVGVARHTGGRKEQ